MAYKKISELEELTQVADSDLLVVVDSSENETKKIKVENFGAGGDSLPINTVVEYNGSTVPDGYELYTDNPLIKTQKFSRTITLGSSVADYWALGSLSTPSGYTFIGILANEIGNGVGWQTSFGTSGNTVYAYTKSYTSSVTGTISCTALYLRN